MTNRAQELIKAFYEEEAARKESEITFSDFTVRLNSADIAMLEVIAKRFGKSADRIASEALSAAIYSMVEALEASERKNLAKDADELDESLAKKAAKSNGKPDYNEKSVTWVMNDRAITREENKRKKELEKQETYDTEPKPEISTTQQTDEYETTTDNDAEMSPDAEMEAAPAIASVFPG